jgi:hypothetical protein
LLSEYAYDFKGVLQKFKKQPKEKISLQQGDLPAMSIAYQQTYPQQLWTTKRLWAIGQRLTGQGR